MSTAHAIFCNGLVEKPKRWPGHLEALDRLLWASLNRRDADIQLNVDWRPLGMKVEDAVLSARDHYGERLKSLVTYWDPAHSANEIINLFSLLARLSVPLLVRLNIRSAESVRVFTELASEGFLDGAIPVLNIDSCSYATAAALRAAAGGRARFQVSHETPRSVLDLLDSSLIAVVQVAIGSAASADERGNIQLDDGMVVRGRYSLPAYVTESAYPNARLVVMGPTLPAWDEAENLKRLKKVTSLLDFGSTEPVVEQARAIRFDFVPDPRASVSYPEVR